MRQALWVTLLAVGAVALLAGCSGAGAPPSEVAGASVKTLAADQVSAVLLFASWSEMLYVKSARQASVPVRTPLPDGTLQFTGTNSDGSTYVWVVDHPYVEFSSGHGSITWPDGTAFTEEWDATDMAPDYSHSTDHIRDTFPNGSTLECTIVANYSAQTQSLWDGTATTKQGTTMNFHLDRVQDGLDQLTLNLPGAVMTMRVPNTIQVAGTQYWPVFSQGATGTYQATGHPQLALTLTGTDRWTQWGFTVPDGTTGTFSLDANLLGQGKLTRAGATLGALGWSADNGNWQGSLNLLGSGQQSVSPSAAARAFQMNRWIANGAAMGPMPMY